MSDYVGKIISHYRIYELIGRGGMGVVYKAEDTKLKRTVALKFLPPVFSFDQEAKKRFINEAQTASSLQHHNICNIHDIDETKDGQIFICMDCYEGETLKKKIERGQIKTDEAIDIIVQVAAGLQKAHEKGIIHRDIKPANIFITNDGVVKILDFGLAKLSGQTMMTKMGETVGTIAYMSPEQSRGELVDQRTDIWSLGVVLYEMLTRSLPFKGDYDSAMIYSILNEEPERTKEVSKVLEKIICRSLAKQPENRYQSIAELIADLEAYKTDTQLSKKTRRLASKRKTFLYGGITIGLVIAAAATVILIFPSRSNGMTSLAVLPFINVSNNPEIEYLCDGLAEALTDQMSRLPQLKKVTAFNGLLYFKGKDILPTEIGKQLGVENLLITRLSKQGDSLTLSLELLDAKENKHIWGGRFEEALNQTYKIPQTIFLSLVQDLHVTGIFEQPESGTEVSEAYRLYLQARHYYHKANTENFRFSLKYYLEAIALDPSFSLAYSGLAESLLQLSPDEFPWVEIRDSAMKCAVKAVELDDQSSQAYSALGVVKFIEADLKGAEQMLLKSLALNPLNSEGYHYYAHLLGAQKDFDKAVEMMHRALDLAPYSVFNRVCLGQIYSFAGRWNEALSTFENACEMDSTFTYNLFRCQFEFALDKREFKKAKEYARLVSTTHIAAPWEMEWRLTRIEALSGRKNEALRHLSKVRDLTQNILGHQRHEIDLLVFASLYAELGMKSQALDLIESAFAQHASYVYMINNMSEFDVLRDDPRFTVILRRGGFIY